MQTIDLNGLWDFVVDLDPKYHDDRAIHASPTYARPDWDRRRWHKVAVPGVWNKYAERLNIYEGVCWYAREFAAPSLPKGATALLRFGGVNYACRVFLNGTEIGGHEGGYTEFVVDVSTALREGRNHVAVQVDNRATTTKLPPCLGYFNYGGIHRDVTLELHPSAFIADLFLRCEPSEQGGRLRAEGHVTKAKNGMRVAVACNGVEVAQGLDGDGAFRAEIDVPSVTPWTPQTPALYPVRVRLVEDETVLHEVAQHVGFRRIEIADGRILLNGNPIFLKGICYVYDSPAHGLVLKPEQFLTDLALVKELGAEAIRSHFPFTHEFYEACDRMGIMVWIEPPIYCLHPKTDATGTVFADPAFKALAASMLREMILHARNHPSVILYSAGNECNTDNAEARAFFQELCDEVRRLDDTRLLSYASLYGRVGPLAEMVDVVGVNEYWGWYDRIYGGKGLTPEEEAMKGRADVRVEPIDLTALEKKLDELKESARKPLLLTEFGADSIPGYSSRSRDLWSEEYHADLIRDTFALAKRHPEICGTFPFCLTDYRDPSKFVNAYWDYMNYKGVVSYERRPKLAFHALKTIYGRNCP